jgi:hypothetical protein
MGSTMSNLNVTRWIRGFDKVRGKMLVEYRLPDSWTLDRLQDLFGVEKDDPMYDCFLINEDAARFLEPDIGTRLVAEDREFFLEADAEG